MENLDGVYLRPIAHIRTDYAQKFGIPRQSGLVSCAQGIIEFEPEFAKNKAVMGLDEFTHLWLLWHFQNGLEGGSAQDMRDDYAAEQEECTPTSRSAQEVVDEALNRRWSTTVRPPRLGGSVRKGVFATRSPFRPNPIGLSCVKIDFVETSPQGPLIHVLGADLRDGTPIFDIKPYLPLADCWPEASGGFTEQVPAGLLSVEIDSDLLECIPSDKQDAVIQVLENDPRPVGSNDPNHIYSLAYAGLEIQFMVADGTATVLEVSAL